jgi:FOG: WD40 repeat
MRNGRIPHANVALALALCLAAASALVAEPRATAIAFGPDGTELVAAYADGSLRALDAASGNAKREIAGWLSDGERAKIRALALDPSGSYLACGGWFERGNDLANVRIVDYRSGKALKNLNVVGLSCVVSLRFSPDGQFLAAGDAEGELHVFRARDWLEDRTMRTPQGDSVYGLAFSPDGRRVACGSFDGSLRVISVPYGVDISNGAGMMRGTILAKRDVAHAGGLCQVAWSPDGNVIATGGLEGELRLWAPKDLSPLGTAAKVPAGDLSRVAFLGDGRLVCGGSYGEGERARPLIVASLDGAAQARIRCDAGNITDIAVAPDGLRGAALCGEDGKIVFWDSRDATELPADGAPAVSMAGTSASPQLGAAERPLLRIDPEGHSSSVTDIAFSPDGTELVTASRDKKIIVSDAATGATRRVLRGWISDGDIGEVDKIAMDPLARYLASSGDFAGNDESERADCDAIRVFDYKTGEIVALLKGHLKPVSTLRFSPDGKILASGDSGGMVKLWRTEDWSEGPKLEKRHGKAVRGLAFSPDGRLLATAGDDLSIHLSSVDDGALRSWRDYAHLTSIRGLAYSPDGKRIATSGGDGAIKLWSADGLAYLDTPKETEYDKDFSVKEYLCFVDDGTLAYACPGHAKDKSGVPFPIFLLDLASKTERIFRGQGNVVQAIAVSPDGRSVASSGGNESEVLVWDPRDLATRLTLVGHGKSVWDLGYDDRRNSVLFAAENLGGFGDEAAPLDRSFDTASGVAAERSAQSRGEEIERAILRSGGSALRLTETNALATGKGLIQLPMRDDTIRAFVNKIDDVICSYTFTPDGKHIIIGTGRGFLYRADAATRAIDGEFVGHEGQVTSLCVSRDGKTLISGSLDKTIKFWDIDSFDGETRLKDASMFNAKWLLYVHGLYRGIDVHWSDDLRELYEQLLKRSNADAQRMRVIPRANPLLSLFVGADLEWIAWTPEGYYYCSLDGAKHAGWQFNRGPGESAEFYSLEQYASAFYRPDVIEKALARARLVLPTVNFGNRPPRITELKVDGRPVYDGGEIAVETDNSEFSLEIASEGTTTLRQPELFYNGRIINQGKFKGPPQLRLAPDKRSLTANYSFTVRNRDNRYKIYTVDERGFKSEARTIHVVYTGKDAEPSFYKLGEKVAAPAASGTLYVLSVGINGYANPAMAAAGMANLSYAEKDAQDMAALWKGQEGKLFDRVEARVLTASVLGRDVRKDDVLDALTALGKKATRDSDSVLLFLSGHGLRKDDGFFFLSSEADPMSKASLEATSPSWLAIGDRLKAMTRVKEIVVLVDACHSGAINPTEMGFTWKDKGVILITSSRAGQRSYEGGTWVDDQRRTTDFTNGLFTTAIVDGFTKKAAALAGERRAPADASQDDVLIVGEVLSYAIEEVGKWTQDQQTPWMPAYDPALEGKIIGVVR